mmetsp:Transcript_24350/g.72829  ORF Transcript_24350/g.72829 Transcript_24350/m.72829 type:complete len:1194 (+) Transcript_24350:117-3698(+)
MMPRGMAWHVAMASAVVFGLVDVTTGQLDQVGLGFNQVQDNSICTLFNASACISNDNRILISRRAQLGSSGRPRRSFVAPATEHCLFYARGDFRLDVVDFTLPTDADAGSPVGADLLLIGGTRFSGTTGPTNVPVTAGTAIAWRPTSGARFRGLGEPVAQRRKRDHDSRRPDLPSTVVTISLAFDTFAETIIPLIPATLDLPPGIPVPVPRRARRQEATAVEGCRLTTVSISTNPPSALVTLNVTPGGDDIDDTDQLCVFLVQANATVNTIAFDTSANDVLIVGAEVFSGADDPSDVIVASGTPILWASDSRGERLDFTICAGDRVIRTPAPVPSSDLFRLGPLSSAAASDSSVCQLLEGNSCISDGASSDYGNGESCAYVALQDFELDVQEFAIGSGVDLLLVGGTQFSGVAGPNGTFVAAGTAIVWRSDGTSPSALMTIRVTFDTFAAEAAPLLVADHSCHTSNVWSINAPATRTTMIGMGDEPPIRSVRRRRSVTVAGDGNDQLCVFVVQADATVDTVEFLTEENFDILTVGATIHSGSNPPADVLVTSGTPLLWVSDNNGTAAGYRVCNVVTTTSAPSAQPTAAPTPLTPFGHGSASPVDLLDSSVCQLTRNGACITDGDGNYSNNEDCAYVAQSDFDLDFELFETADETDMMLVGGTQFSGTVGPTNFSVPAGSAIVWRKHGLGNSSMTFQVEGTLIAGSDLGRELVNGGVCQANGSEVPPLFIATVRSGDAASQLCIFVIDRDATMNTLAFDTEPNVDILTVGATILNGSDLPDSLHVTSGTPFLWVSDNESTAAGYRVCTQPTFAPTSTPSPPTQSPAPSPTAVPSRLPTQPTTITPTKSPTSNPSTAPSAAPTRTPTTAPTVPPTHAPSLGPTNLPSATPTTVPTTTPSTAPTEPPTHAPSPSPTNPPSTSPTTVPTGVPTSHPTVSPTLSTCADISLSANDIVCADDCFNTVSGQCSCAVMFDDIPAGGSCTSVCASHGMACARRYSDGPQGNECVNFETNGVTESCDATGDDDDVCVCSRPPATLNACSAIVGTLGPDDVICGDQCAQGTCDCAVLFDSIPAGGSCSSMCALYGMTCTARFNDGPRLPGQQCKHFAAGTSQQACGDNNDDDDVCVCSATAPPGRRKRAVVGVGAEARTASAVTPGGSIESVTNVAGASILVLGAIIAVVLRRRRLRRSLSRAH